MNNYERLLFLSFVHEQWFVQRRKSRLKRCISIGSYQPNFENPNGRPQYRVDRNILKEWGELSFNDGWIQRNVSLPKFKDTERFLKWFNKQELKLVAKNNLT